MIVAQIAWNYLNQTNTTSPAVLNALENAVNSLVTYANNSNTFVTAAVWMDDIKYQGVSQFSNWHYINLPICDFENTTTDECNGISVDSVLLGDEEDVLWAIESAINTTKANTAQGFGRGFALRNLLHLVGDIHQPLHAVARYSPETPNGDDGGNKFLLQGAFSNLHLFWDSGLGLLNNSINRPLASDAAAYILNTANQIMAATANLTANEGTTYNITQWALDSRELAMLYVYNLTFNSTPSQEYIELGWPIVVQQLGLAGYRLNVVLQQLVPCRSDQSNCPDLNPPSNNNNTWTIVAIALAVVLCGSALANTVLIYSVCKRKAHRDHHHHNQLDESSPLQS